MSIPNLSPFEDQPYDVKLDTCGLKCPLPLLKTKQALQALSSKKVLWVISSEASFALDVKTLVRQTGDTLVAAEQEGLYHFLITSK